jgi:pseudaminic acid synthase
MILKKRGTCMPETIKIKDRIVGDGYPCYIIAEMSANHGGDYERAVEIIKAAKTAGADCIKIQTYTPDTITIDSNNDCFQIKEGPWKGQTLHALYEKAFTPWDWQKDLKKVADEVGIDFLSTPFDNTAVDFLESLNISAYKISSFEAVDIPLIKYIASKKKPIFLSIGMATLGEVEDAVNAMLDEKNNLFCLLKCSSAYPALPEEMNLKTITHLKNTFNVPVGLSDHSLGFISAIVAVSLGASVIEKHFCLSRKIKTPDSDFSMEPAEFKDLVNNVRIAEKSLGRVNYHFTPQESSSRLHRRSLFAGEDIKKGEIFTAKNMRSVRPADGLPPKFYFSILGKKSTRDIKKGTPLRWGMVEGQ